MKPPEQQSDPMLVRLLGKVSPDHDQPQLLATIYAREAQNQITFSGQPQWEESTIQGTPLKPSMWERLKDDA